MLSIWFPLLPLILSLHSGASNNAVPENIYSLWFFNPPAGSPTLVVGYSSVHSYLDSAISAAKREAARNYVKIRQVQIVGEQGLATLAVGTITVGSTIKEYYDTTEAERLAGKLKMLDYFQRGGSVALLASTDSVANVPGAKRVDAATVPIPLWATNIPEQAGYIYNSGMAPMYYNEFNSWLEAERKARINLALTVYTKVKFLGKKSDNIYFREFQIEETNVTLHSIDVVARWKDVKNQICYVLMRVPVGN